MKTKRFMTIDITEDGKIIADVGKTEVPIFKIIGVLSKVILGFSKSGFDKEAEEFKNLKEHIEHLKGGEK